MIRLRRWRGAIDLWTLDLKVCNWMQTLVEKEFWVEVLTWHPPEFAEQIHSRLWSLDIFVGEVKATQYNHISPRMAVDRNVVAVYDPDPAHRYGYGYKCREFSSSFGNI